jgi:hypothetical protein
LPDPQRHDPPSRTVDGAINEITYWSNLDPSRVYCEANPNDADTGVQEMRRLGWRVEVWHKDGPRLIGGDAASDGSALTRNGMIFMSRPREKQKAYEAEKYAKTDRRSASIGQFGGADPVVGQYGAARSTVDSREQRVRG